MSLKPRQPAMFAAARPADGHKETLPQPAAKHRMVAGSLNLQLHLARGKHVGAI